MDLLSKKIEQKIIDSIEYTNSLNFKPKAPIASSADVDLINEYFSQDGITSVYESNVSLNESLNYLMFKQQIEGCPVKNKEIKAFFIDRFSLYYIEKLKTDSVQEFNTFLEKIKNKEIILYSFNNSEKEKQQVNKRFYELTNIDLQEIKDIKPKNNASSSCNKKQMDNYPTYETIKKVIKGYAQATFPLNEEASDELARIAAKYLLETSLTLSYSRISYELKQKFNQIKQEIESQGESLDNVIYILPEKSKSYNLINYLYALENDIAPDKFMTLAQASKQLDVKDNDRRVFVVLDDVAMSGFSMCNDVIGPFVDKIYKNNKGKNLILAPLVYTQDAQNKINYKIGKIESYNKVKAKLLEGIKYDSIGYILTIKETANFKNADGYKELGEYLSRFKNLDEQEINYLLKTISGGYYCQFSSIFLPYMIIDNSSDISAIINSYFLNHDTERINHALAYSNLKRQGKALTYENYLKIKNSET